LVFRATTDNDSIDGSFIGLVVTGSAAMFVAVWYFFAAPLPTVKPVTFASSVDTEHASFGFCHTGGGNNCVVDGDTFYYGGTKVRIADIDTPETHPPRCESEAQRGATATQRLQDLLNEGSFSLKSIDRDVDVYGRKLRIVTRGGESLGGVLVKEDLARWYEGGRQPWC
jgi:micrococcal nuclease